MTAPPPPKTGEGDERVGSPLSTRARHGIADSPQKLVLRERLGEARHVDGNARRQLGIAGRQHDRQAGLLPSGPVRSAPRRVMPGMPWSVTSRSNFRRCSSVQCFPCRIGARHAMAAVFEHRGGVHQHQRIVVHRQDRRAAPDRASPPAPAPARWRAAPAQDRQPQARGRALARLALQTAAARPSCSAMPCTIDRPRPVPLPTPLVVKNGSIARCSVASSMPSPRVDHRQHGIAARLPGRAALSVASVILARRRARWSRPSGMASRAFTARLSSAISSWLRSAMTGPIAERRADDDVDAWRRASGRSRSAMPRHQEPEYRSARLAAPGGARRPACAG